MTEVPDGASDFPTPDDRRAPALSGAVLVHVALSRYAANFLLNDVDPAVLSQFTVEVPVIEGVNLPGHAPERRDTDVERLHHARVGLRRMRSTLRTFDEIFDPRWSGALRRELSWYGQVLGEARDLEVMRDNLANALGPTAQTEIGILLLGRVDAAIADARMRRDEARASERYRVLVTAVSAIGVTIESTPKAFRPARKALRRGLKTAWGNVEASRQVARRRPTSRRLHRLRIELKRLQYAAEIVGVVDEGPVARLAEGAEGLQTRLGRVHDAVVAKQWLDQFDGYDDADAATVGELRARYRATQRELVDGWRHQMSRVRRRWREVDL